MGLFHLGPSPQALRVPGSSRGGRRDEFFVLLESPVEEAVSSSGGDFRELEIFGFLPILKPRPLSLLEGFPEAFGA